MVFGVSRGREARGEEEEYANFSLCTRIIIDTQESCGKNYEIYNGRSK